MNTRKHELTEKCRLRIQNEMRQQDQVFSPECTEVSAQNENEERCQFEFINRLIRRHFEKFFGRILLLKKCNLKSSDKD